MFQMAFESQAYLSKQIDYGRFPATNLQIFFNTTKKNEKKINFSYILFNFPSIPFNPSTYSFYFLQPPIVLLGGIFSKSIIV